MLVTAMGVVMLPAGGVTLAATLEGTDESDTLVSAPTDQTTCEAAATSGSISKPDSWDADDYARPLRVEVFYPEKPGVVVRALTRLAYAACLRCQRNPTLRSSSLIFLGEHSQGLHR